MTSQKKAENKQRLLKHKFRKYRDMWENEHDDRGLIRGMYDQLQEACDAMKGVENNFVWCAFNARYAKQHNDMCEIVERFTGKHMERLIIL